MPVEANKDLVRRHIELSWNAADFDALDDVWAADAVVHLYDGRTLRGLDALKEHLRAVVLVWTDRVCEIEALVGEDDIVANHWSFSGTSASGERFATTGMDFYRFSEDRIVEEWIALGAAGPPA